MGVGSIIAAIYPFRKAYEIATGNKIGESINSSEDNTIRRSSSLSETDIPTESKTVDKQIIDGEAYWMKPDEDCMGNPTRGYWRASFICSNGQCVMGCGSTKKEAEKVTQGRRDEVESLLNLPIKEKIKKILSSECYGIDRQEELNKAFAELLLKT